MTDKTPAMPQLAIQLLAAANYIDTLGGNSKSYRIALAALQSAQPAAVSEPALLGAIARGWCHPKNSGKEVDADLAAAIASEILALRPQAVPMTDEQIRPMCKQDWVFETVKQWVRVIEAHHGITQRADGGEKQA